CRLTTVRLVREDSFGCLVLVGLGEGNGAHQVVKLLTKTATNQNLEKAIAAGSFRKDLYYRLNVMEIYIPPLRERKKDIEPLSRFFLAKHTPGYRKRIKGFSRDAIQILRNYSYPGNVRELENIIERAVILEKSPVITPESLPQ
ncbi:MAG: sigma 54-interacting transcriptional regulator, partial [Actinobacteria bacterium]|nr:sigma 54-interacting transcriptional regulator [Actinomycetota bacterium]